MKPIKSIKKKIIKPIGRDLKQFGKNVAKTTKLIIQGSNDYPPNVKQILDGYGNEVVKSIVLKRNPVSGLLTGALNVLSLGKFGERMEKSFDELFHLYLEFSTTNGTKILLEKNERINMELNPKDRPDTTIREISNIPQGLTINQILERTKQFMGSQFFQYDARNNNCQDFIVAILKSNGIGNDADIHFVKQDTDRLFKGLDILGKIAHTATELGERGNIALQGGKLSKNQNIKTYGTILEHLITHIKDPSEPIDPKDYKQAIKVVNTIKKLKGKGLKKKSPSQVQSIIFNKSEWTIPKAKKWLKQHSYEGLIPDVKEATIRFRQQEPSEFNDFRIKPLPNGILLVLGFK